MWIGTENCKNMLKKGFFPSFFRNNFWKSAKYLENMQNMQNIKFFRKSAKYLEKYFLNLLILLLSLLIGDMALLAFGMIGMGLALSGLLYFFVLRVKVRSQMPTMRGFDNPLHGSVDLASWLLIWYYCFHCQTFIIVNKKTWYLSVKLKIVLWCRYVQKVTIKHI